MPSTMEFWLLDDTGRRICLLDQLAYFSYSRSTLGYGTLLIGMPHDVQKARVFPIFQPDWRIDVWRSPAEGVPMRREQTFLLRLHKIYTRKTDNMRMIAYTGLDPTHLLSRRYVVQAAGSAYTYKTDNVDDMMKEIVREQMLWGFSRDEEGNLDDTRAFPRGEFSVQSNMGLGPSVSAAFADRRVLDVLKDLKLSSFQLNQFDLSSRRIFFDVVPYDISSLLLYILDEATGEPILDEAGLPLVDESSTTMTGVGFQFQTFADLRGQDRTLQMEFSVENNNLEEPYYSLNHIDEVTAAIVKGFGRGDSRVAVWVEDTTRENSSRWNRVESFVDGSQEPDQSKLADVGYPELFNGMPKEDLSTVFLNTEGGPDSPRSLYGLDWDLGDLVRVSYAGKQFDIEIAIVYVAIDEQGIETITGRNQISATLG